jgi:hypothetical protein
MAWWRAASLGAAGVAIAAIGFGAVHLFNDERSEPVAQPQAEAPKAVALYCQFYVFVESRPYVAFLLNQAQDDAGRYLQAYVAKADGDRTDYNALVERTPEWRLDRSGEPPRIEAKVTVPDQSQAGVGEQDIAIELRDFDAAQADGVWREASLKSVYYQNLPGKCRQAAMRSADQRPEG